MLQSSAMKIFSLTFPTNHQKLFHSAVLAYTQKNHFLTFLLVGLRVKPLAASLPAGNHGVIVLPLAHHCLLAEIVPTKRSNTLS